MHEYMQSILKDFTVQELIENAIQKGKEDTPQSRLIRNFILSELYMRNPEAHDLWRENGDTDEMLFKYYGV